MSITINILLVDDVEYSRELLRAALLVCIREYKKEIDVNFFHSSTGESIPEKIILHNVNLVYLDIELPHTSGLEVLKQIRKKHPDLMVVMVSGESSAQNVTSAIKSGANGFIVKPFNSGRILDTLQNYLKKEKEL
ncbi:response regulator [uncultured Paraglaciecola sp.]|uniref:response regulator n=1 Tax=uncultured Paraglaciecola sp. TaxID=1765024 RepID=UPI0030DA8CAD|tara:strand:+ start:26687 stop:27091 length:405 start_codon:yes stop_codon:yes gene_type:complete